MMECPNCGGGLDTVREGAVTHYYCGECHPDYELYNPGRVASLGLGLIVAAGAALGGIVALMRRLLR